MATCVRINCPNCISPCILVETLDGNWPLLSIKRYSKYENRKFYARTCSLNKHAMNNGIPLANGNPTVQHSNADYQSIVF